MRYLGHDWRRVLILLLESGALCTYQVIHQILICLLVNHQLVRLVLTNLQVLDYSQLFLLLGQMVLTCCGASWGLTFLGSTALLNQRSGGCLGCWHFGPITVLRDDRHVSSRGDT